MKENGSSHKTSMYELVSREKALVVRRGAPFILTVSFTKEEFDPAMDKLKLVFKTGLFLEKKTPLYYSFFQGDYPSITRGTMGVAVVESDGNFLNKRSWEAITANYSGGKITISVMVPVNAPVGLWEVAIETWYGDNAWSTKKKYDVKLPIYIIFNPFNSADPTYMHNPADHEEYVMEDMGKIYSGSANSFRGRPWVFGQFEAGLRSSY